MRSQRPVNGQSYEKRALERQSYRHHLLHRRLLFSPRNCHQFLRSHYDEVMTKNLKLRKVAVDSVAAEYWRSYYSESGYGEAWVKKIPMRIRAELQRKKNAADSNGKTAAATESPNIRPIATVITDEGVALEGVAIYDSGRRQAFAVEFDHNG